MKVRALLAGLLVGVLAACSGTEPEPAAAPVAPVVSASPSAAASAPESDVLWLCEPEQDGDPCDGELPTAAVAFDGSVAQEPFAPAAPAPVDCLSIYPTVSSAPGANAPLEADADVVSTVRAQAARFAEVCELHVPVYRQLTRGSILSGEFFAPGPRDIAYADVLAAWQDLVARDDSRGIVLVGHSQGAMMLTRLIAEQVSGRPELEQRLVSALLIGGNVSVPQGQDAGGDTGDVPVCREPGQTGCVVAYSSFLDTPPEGSFFGRAAAGRQVVCTDPTLLAGGDGTLHPYLPTALLSPGLGAAAPVPAQTEAVFVTYRDSARAACREEGGASFLQVTPVPGAPLPTPDQPLGPAWGLHIADVNLALGDLVEVVRRQAAAWTG